jgi:hypothetical protein
VFFNVLDVGIMGIRPITWGLRTAIIKSATDSRGWILEERIPVLLFFVMVSSNFMGNAVRGVLPSVSPT